MSIVKVKVTWFDSSKGKTVCTVSSERLDFFLAGNKPRRDGETDLWLFRRAFSMSVAESFWSRAEMYYM